MKDNFLKKIMYPYNIMDNTELIDSDELLEDSIRIININNELTKIEREIELINDSICKLVSNINNSTYLIEIKK